MKLSIKFDYLRRATRYQGNNDDERFVIKGQSKRGMYLRYRGCDRDIAVKNDDRGCY